MDIHMHLVVARTVNRWLGSFYASLHLHGSRRRWWSEILASDLLLSHCSCQVTLCLPWISKSDQERLFPANAPRFDTPEAQVCPVWA